jgi:hypothetical protein
MVTKTTDDGKGFYHEPPCTEEEEDDFYRRVGGGPISILHAPKKPKPKDDEEIGSDDQRNSRGRAIPLDEGLEATLRQLIARKHRPGFGPVTSDVQIDMLCEVIRQQRADGQRIDVIARMRAKHGSEARPTGSRSDLAVPRCEHVM